jgi:hypothetical protein
MPKISSYPVPSGTQVSVDDLLIGTDRTAVGAPDATKNFPIQDIINLALTKGVFTGGNALPSYDDDAAAGAAGLAAGKLFQTTGAGAAPLNAAGIVMIKQ